MPRIRFRIRTIMIVSAAVAVMLAVVVWMSELRVIFRVRAMARAIAHMFTFTQIITIVVLGAVLLVSLVEFAVFSHRYCSQRRRPAPRSRIAHRVARDPGSRSNRECEDLESARRLAKHSPM
jgi:hypothetical protein